jgi:hypothetical protein
MPRERLMSGDFVRNLRRWMLPIWVTYTAVWVVWWAYTLAFGDGLDDPGDVVRLVVSGILGALGLFNGWVMRREGRSDP